MRYYTPLDSLWHGRADVEFLLLRLDLYTARAIGNKQFKLAKNLLPPRLCKGQRALSFGGAWSNHLLAFAELTAVAGVESVGVVRGDEGFDNEMLARMRRAGMRLHFVSRADYRRRHDLEYCQELCRQLRCDIWLPEGGSNQLAVSGCEEIASLINGQALGSTVCPRTTKIVLAVGTGATAAGLIRGCHPHQQVIGIPVVNDPGVAARVEQWIAGAVDPANWSMYQSAQLHKYARPSSALLEFIIDFHHRTGIALDPVYTGPAIATALSGAFMEQSGFKERVVFVHTGGLAGASGFATRFEQCADQLRVKSYFERIEDLAGIAGML